MAQPPYKLDQPLPIARGSDGKFREVRSPAVGPTNPLVVEASGGIPSNWAPGIGQNTAATKSPSIAWPPASVGAKPFRVG